MKLLFCNHFRLSRCTKACQASLRRLGDVLAIESSSHCFRAKHMKSTETGDVKKINKMAKLKKKFKT
jgi:hypothetical protein